MSETVDLFVIGGGINGAGVARDAAGRGLSVVLCEKDDLAQGTSSRSGKLVHGGLRYLEYYEFRLVREALIEREVLLNAAPHIIWPMRFVLPHSPDDRPAWLVRLGLFLYDHLGGRKKLPGTRVLNLRRDPEGAPIKDAYAKGFEYSDCWVDDSRLVVLNARDAVARGAQVMTRTDVLSATRDGDIWRIETKNTDTGEVTEHQARMLVNAGGPWVAEIIHNTVRLNSSEGVRLVRGSHIVTRKLYDHDKCYFFQGTDGRIIFAIPYEHDYTLIGTTDKPYDLSEGKVKISPEEITYLCEAASEYFENDISPEDVVWTYAGVRPLYDDKSEDASAVTRDYVLDIEEFTEGAPFLSVYGGKITTSRKLAEHTMQKLEKYYHYKTGDWTETALLPGGDLIEGDFERFVGDMRKRYPALDDAVLRRLCHGYGTRITLVLGDGDPAPKLGQHFGAGLYELEANYLIHHEWATSAEDILFRRTKLGLHMSKDEIAGFAEWFDARA